MVTTLYVAVWRAERRLVLLASVRTVQFGIVALISLALIEPVGINGPAVTWLVVQSLAAVVLFAVSPRVLLGDDSRPPRHSRRTFALRNAAARTGLLSLSHRAAGWAGGRGRRDHAEVMLPAVLERLPADGFGSSSRTWEQLELRGSVTDKSVILVGEPGAGPSAVVMLATSPSASRTLEREAAVLHELTATAGRRERPVLLASGEIDGEHYLHRVRAARCRGVAFVLAWRRPVRLPRASRSADRRAPPPDGSRAGGRRLPARDLGRRSHRSPRSPHRRRRARRVGATALANLEAELRRSLQGRTVTVGRTHGDYAPGNVLLAHHGRAVAGILDWELSSGDGISALDHTHLALTSNALFRRREIGEVVARALGDRLDAPERAFLDGACSALCPAVPVRALVLLDWLRHVTDVLSQSERYADKRVWAALNVDSVLSELA